MVFFFLLVCLSCMRLSGLPGFGCLFISPLLGKFSIIIFSNIFLCFFFLSSSGTSIIQILEPLILSQRSLKLLSFLFSLFQILLCFRYFHHSIFQLTYLAFFVCLHLLFCYWFPLAYCFICYCAFHHCFLFSSSAISLLKFSLSS